MFNFLVIQPGSSVSFLCAHVRITAAKRQVHLVPIALRESFSPGLPSPPSVMGRDMKAISQTPACQRQSSHCSAHPGEIAGMLEARGCGWSPAAFPSRFLLGLCWERSGGRRGVEPAASRCWASPQAGPHREGILGFSGQSRRSRSLEGALP